MAHLIVWPEWPFFTSLVRADRRLALTWWGCSPPAACSLRCSQSPPVRSSARSQPAAP